MVGTGFASQKGSVILDCLLSKMFPGSIGQTGPEHLENCCTGPKPSPVPALPVKNQVAGPEPGRPFLSLLFRAEGSTGLSDVVWPHAQTMATQFANLTLDSQLALSEGTNGVMARAFEIRRVPANAGFLSLWQVPRANEISPHTHFFFPCPFNEDSPLLLF